MFQDTDEHKAKIRKINQVISTFEGVRIVLSPALPFQYKAQCSQLLEVLTKINAAFQLREMQNRRRNYEHMS